MPKIQFGQFFSYLICAEFLSTTEIILFGLVVLNLISHFTFFARGISHLDGG